MSCKKPPIPHFHFSLGKKKFFSAQGIIFPCPEKDFSLGINQNFTNKEAVNRFYKIY